VEFSPCSDDHDRSHCPSTARSTDSWTQETGLAKALHHWRYIDRPTLGRGRHWAPHVWHVVSGECLRHVMGNHVWVI
jgi:hypothetical protein